ncbi:MAG TPA: hypothetical protein PLV42_06825 [bacterium]|nr:hypothetical protein [bacterium]
MKEIFDIQEGVLENLLPDCPEGVDFQLIKLMSFSLTAPSDGILLDAYSAITVSWNKRGTENGVNLYYSLDGGETRIFIALVANPTSTYSWTPPVNPDELNSSAFSVMLIAEVDGKPDFTAAASLTLYNNTVIGKQVTNFVAGDAVDWAAENDALVTFDTQTIVDS